MTRTDIEQQFNPRVSIAAAEVERYAERASALSRATRERWSQRKACRLDVPYGESRLATLDIFPVADPNAPLHVFLHGGYWRARDKSDYSFVADALAPHGISTIVMNYDLCPDVEVGDIVEQVRRGFSWIRANAGAFSCQAANLTASGHSAGAHLIAAALSDSAYRDGPDAALLISGIYELEPVLHISVNEQIRLRPEAVDGLSPLRHPPQGSRRLAMVAGSAEPPAWVAQSRDFAQLCKRQGHDCLYGELLDDDHYSIMTHFESPCGWLSRLAAGMALRPTDFPTTNGVYQK
ncbi:alpha/beta hydrolase [Pollutimonas sp. M17]|uniref:alpha/beta hydrolase n=1 Tax=Pollutimonas sp. M17 TaxID=2962065 RepID=UPI0021F40699|nr:alpha/beta hydrolase [Pollutimonas sp. M17]UYO94833.1 alpha/beta hydrolase [Pollutimonas sp. M17]HWK72102.1 alpha/beta hydrolase [Burkholderiaceae bacterium]